MSYPFLQHLTSRLADVPGIAAVVLGGSRARGTATDTSDYDIGLYYGSGRPLNTDRLLEVVRCLVDDPGAAAVTQVGEWGTWIVGGGWLTVGGTKVDLLYRSTESVRSVIEACQAGHITMDYQPGHPHGFCSAAWMGEVALCQTLHDPRNLIADLKAMTSPYPRQLQAALLRRFAWEVLFSIENGEIAARRGEQTHVAGCVYRALCCAAQVLFALNERYLINEKAALEEAASFPLTIGGLTERVGTVWLATGRGEFGAALAELRLIEQALSRLAKRGMP